MMYLDKQEEAMAAGRYGSGIKKCMGKGCKRTHNAKGAPRITS
jgi:predicted aconitase